jgi:hypothetical protein
MGVLFQLIGKVWPTFPDPHLFLVYPFQDKP